VRLGRRAAATRLDLTKTGGAIAFQLTRGEDLLLRGTLH
jgi:hypothetical protein